MGDKGRVYKEGWDRIPRPVEGFFGPKEAEPKRGFLTGEPVPARDFLGNQKKASDGTPLYETKPGSLGSNSDGDAATGIAILVIAAVVGTAVAVAVAGKVVVQRFAASAKADVHDRRLSLATAGYGLVILWVAGFALAYAAGPRSSGGFASVVWTLDTVAFLCVIILGLFYAPARLGELARARRDTKQPVEHFWRWAFAAVAEAGLTLAVGWELIVDTQTDPGHVVYAFVALILFVAAPALGQIGAFAWAWNGRPNVVRPTIARVRNRSATGPQAAMDPPSNDEVVAEPSRESADLSGEIWTCPSCAQSVSGIATSCQVCGCEFPPLDRTHLGRWLVRRCVGPTLVVGTTVELARPGPSIILSVAGRSYWYVPAAETTVIAQDRILQLTHKSEEVGLEFVDGPPRAMIVAALHSVD